LLGWAWNWERPSFLGELGNWMRFEWGKGFVLWSDWQREEV
jgi:hypothetical protein